jgi:cytochrome c biogenesis protein CcmG/thiol:disulfide interchange protein DsbE
MSWRGAALGLAAASLLLQGCNSSDADPKAAGSGNAGAAVTGPDFSLSDVASGRQVSLSSYRGKVVLLDFWATWCGPCRMEIPHFVELYKQYKDQGFEVIGVSLDQQGVAVVKPFIEQWNVNYTTVIDSNGQLANAYGGIRAIPSTFLIGKNGQILEHYVGYNDKNVFEDAIKKALAAS